MFGFVTLRMRFSGSCISLCAARSLCAGGQLLSELAQDILKKHRIAYRVCTRIPIKSVDIVAKYASPVRACVRACIYICVHVCVCVFVCLYVC